MSEHCCPYCGQTFEEGGFLDEEKFSVESRRRQTELPQQVRGRVGGQKRAMQLTTARRQEIAKAGAAARWKKPTLDLQHD